MNTGRPRTAKPGGFLPPMEAEWHRMISEAAYFRAERRGFAPGGALQDWLEGEVEIKELLQNRQS
jgi:Protein of unknown function (DUF2934)